MCNKRRNRSKYNIRFSVLTLIFVTLLFSACERAPVNEFSIDIEAAKELESAIQFRNIDSLSIFFDHSNDEISRLAWLSAGHSLAVDGDRFFERVVENNSDAAWLALSLNRAGDEFLRQSEALWNQPEINRTGLCSVFRRFGDAQTLQLILDDAPGAMALGECALAAGFIATRHTFDADQIERVLQLAFHSESAKNRRNLLYGFYRNRVNDLRQEPYKAQFLNLWSELGYDDPMLNLMAVKIVELPAAEQLLTVKSRIELLSHTQLAVEITRIFPLMDNLFKNREFLMAFLTHKNPVVAEEAMIQLRRMDGIPNEFLNQIDTQVISPTRNHALFMDGLFLLSDNGVDIYPYERKLHFAIESNPHLAGRALPILKKMKSSENYYSYLMELHQQNDAAGLHATRALQQLWIDGGMGPKAQDYRDWVGELVEAGDRTRIGGIELLLMDEDLFSDDDLRSLADTVLQRLDEHRELSALMARMLENRELMTQNLRDRFLQTESVRLKRSLSELFDEEGDAEQAKSFQNVNWNRLQELGSKPYWRLVTTKGTIVMELDPLTAPFTVSSIDSLTQAGSYNDILFHRVVANFVIQSGDFTLQNGVGAPDYYLPTEPSPDSFEIGALGVASSGVDTEGSQFFVMTQWAPHLDGGYTRFGRVVYGMDVAESIQLGDRIIEATLTAR